MYVCTLYVCICICIYVYSYVYIYICTYIYIDMYIFTYMYMYIYICIPTNINIYTQKWMRDLPHSYESRLIQLRHAKKRTDHKISHYLTGSFGIRSSTLGSCCQAYLLQWDFDYVHLCTCVYLHMHIHILEIYT